MAETVVVEERFRGPPGSGNGGYVAGLLAGYVDAPAVQVRLVAPPPLGTPLEVTRDGDAAHLHDGDVLVATARPGEVTVTLPGTVGVEAAAAAQARTHLRAEDHPFPTCFGCGPEAEHGIHCLAGPVGDGVWAVGWTPQDVSSPVVWAALDCPSAAAGVPPGSRPHVLGTLTARMERPIRAGEPHVCVAWPLEVDGRKRRAGSAVLDAAGNVCAIADALWIELRG